MLAVAGIAERAAVEDELTVRIETVGEPDAVGRLVTIGRGDRRRLQAHPLADGCGAAIGIVGVWQAEEFPRATCLPATDIRVEQARTDIGSQSPGAELNAADVARSVLIVKTLVGEPSPEGLEFVIVQGVALVCAIPAKALAEVD